MKLSDLGEFGLIERIRRTAVAPARTAPIGIGDDAAALFVPPGQLLLATTDMLLEDVHFDLATTDLFSLGWKSAAVNLSDIAAMGGTPRFCLTALGLPASLAVEDITAFYRGLHACLRRHRTRLVGGDTCRSRNGLTVCVTLLGSAPRRMVVPRGGARPGDLIFVTGTLGDSAAGLELLTTGGRGPGARVPGARTRLIERQLRPEPRVAWGKRLAGSGLVTAMIDVSDGLAADLAHLCHESGVGAEICREQIPISKELRAARDLRRTPVEYALSGGEDYELLFTVPPAAARRPTALRRTATEIGTITSRRGMRIVDERGRSRPLAAVGYDHFRRTGTGAADR